MTIRAFTDGASRGNPGESGIGIVLRDDKNDVLFSGGGYIGTTTNNVAEYTALIACLDKIKELRCSKLIVHSDSELMVHQLNGVYKVRDKTLQQFYTTITQRLAEASYAFTIVHIARALNAEADELANRGIDSKLPLKF